MDAADDREVKLQRASGDLVDEFSAKLPSLLWKTRTENGHNIRVPRRWTQANKTEKLIGLVSYHQLPYLKYKTLTLTARTLPRVATTVGPSSAKAPATISRCLLSILG